VWRNIQGLIFFQFFFQSYFVSTVFHHVGVRVAQCNFQVSASLVCEYASVRESVSHSLGGSPPLTHSPSLNPIQPLTFFFLKKTQANQFALRAVSAKEASLEVVNNRISGELWYDESRPGVLVISLSSPLLTPLDPPPRTLPPLPPPLFPPLACVCEKRSDILSKET
jgi:hypothetical protein